MGRGDDDLEFIQNVYEMTEGFVVMAGSTAQQKALELEAVEHGAYTYYLLKALSGEADTYKKSFVSVDDVEKYITHQFKRWRASTGLIQEPTIEKAGMGDMILADWRDRTPPRFTSTSDAQFGHSSVNQRSSSNQQSDSRISDSPYESYVKKLAYKQLELAAVQVNLEICLNRKKELELKKNAEKLLADIDKIEKELSEIDIESGQATVKLTALDKTLKKVDFAENRNIAYRLKRTFESQDYSFGLLLLKRTNKQMGYYCLDEILSTIFDEEMQYILLQKRENSSCKTYIADLANIITRGRPLEFLSLLLEYEGQFASQDLARSGQEFRKSLCATLKSGDRILILVKNWHYEEPGIFLKWFVEEFWKPLLDEIKRCVLPKYGRIRVVAVLASAGQVPLDSLAEIPICSPKDSFHPHHLIEIPLPNWTIEDIQKWFMDVQKLARNESLKLAQQLHIDSKGTPQTICSTLKERYSA